MGGQTREEDGWADKGRGWAGRQEKRTVVQRHCGGRDRVIKYINKSWI